MIGHIPMFNMEIRATVTKVGNSYGATIKKAFVDQGFFKEGQEIIIMSIPKNESNTTPQVLNNQAEAADVKSAQFKLIRASVSSSSRMATNFNGDFYGNKQYVY